MDACPGDYSMHKINVVTQLVVAVKTLHVVVPYELVTSLAHLAKLVTHTNVYTKPCYEFVNVHIRMTQLNLRD